MRRASFGCVALVLLAGTAGAEEVRYSALPVGEVSKPPPKSQVHHVSGKAEGFVLHREGRDYYTLSGEKQTDLQRRTGQPSAACLTSDAERFRGDVKENDWSPQTQGLIAIGRSIAPQVYHREQVVVSGAQTTLETRDAIVDFPANAARVIDRRSLPLAKVATLVAGVTVYAMRSAGAVQFVVAVPPEVAAQTGMMDARSSSSPQDLMAAQCSHLRVAAAATKGEGTAVTVHLHVFEPGESPSAGRFGTAVRVLRLLAVHLSTTWLSGDPEPVISVTSGWVGPSEKVQVASSQPVVQGF